MKKNNYEDRNFNEQIDEQIENEDINKSPKTVKEIFKKMREDKRYKAKVELTGYLVFIIGLVIVLNISNIGRNYDYDGIHTNTSSAVKEKDNEDNDVSLLKSIGNNYDYNVLISVKRMKDDKQEENINFSYNGSSYKENMIINRSINNNISTFYKVTDEYYIKNNDEYDLIDIKEVYNIIDGKYVEFLGLKKLVDKSSLDHLTNYSSGKQEYVYNLKIKDVIKSYEKDDVIEINIIEENGILNVEVDYTNLFKLINDKIIECKINYKYENINKVEKITIFDENISTGKSEN